VVPKTLVTGSTSDSGPGTFRQALLDALAAPGSHTIVFDFPGPPPYIIQLLSPLPELTGPVVLDGWSQPSFSGTPVIELEGSGAAGATGPVDGLVVSGGGSTIRGFILDGFAVAIRLQSANNTIQGNVIGTNPSGGAPLGPLGAGPGLGNGGDGIYISSAGNVVGGAVPAARNIIS
jgi:hypothetical protein